MVQFHQHAVPGNFDLMKTLQAIIYQNLMKQAALAAVTPVENFRTAFFAGGIEIQKCVTIDNLLATDPMR